MRRPERIRVERAIYQLAGSKDYVVISYSKETKKVKTLGRFDNLTDARLYRDTHLRYAKYGKGIMKLKNGKFAAQIMLYAGNGISSFYIGCYDTPELARKARVDFIDSLK